MVGSVAERKNVRDARAWRRFRWRAFALVVVAAVGACALGAVILEVKPSLAAQGAELIRASLGPRVVTALETVVFQMQDAVRRWQYQIGADQAEAPWEIEQGMLEAHERAEVTARGGNVTSPPIRATSELAVSPTAPSRAGEDSRSPPATPTSAIWQLAPLQPMGSLEGEGVWQPYLYDHHGNPVAVRTFLQSDPARPYAVVAVVAFDLTRTRLHFVLGYRDPGLPGGPRGDGLIPVDARKAGLLLAAFNGGFRTVHGMYGAMAEGIVAVPPLPGMATVAIGQDGEVKIGPWGEDLAAAPVLEAWRQNCAPVVEDGTISLRVFNDSVADWGGSVSGSVVTWRSGLGLDIGRRTLYYLAGPSLSMPALAQSMISAGVHDGMLLDINPFWVHFTAFRLVDSGLVAEPLLPQAMLDKVDRYLEASPVDFFYLTLRHGS